MKIAICDDQTECNAKLKDMLMDYFHRMKIGNCIINEYISGNRLLESYAPGMYDLIFLDIVMPEVTGDKTAEQIRKVDLDVDLVFVTNMSDQSLMGYNYHAKGFLIKEVEQRQVDLLMGRLIHDMKHKKKLVY